MNILMLAPQPFLEPRGTPISVYQRVQGLAELGHTVDLVTYHLGQNVSIPGVTVHRIVSVPFITQIKVGPSWYKPLLDLLLLFKAISLLMQRRYDVIHSHEEAAFFAMILAKLFRTRHLYDMHSSLPQQLSNFNVGNYRPLINVFMVLERWAINTSDAMITIGSDLERYARTINPSVPHVMIENLPVQHSGDKADQQVREQLRAELGLQNKLIVVYTGTFERYQGLGLLLESAQIIHQHAPHVAFVLAGGKPQQIAQWQLETRKHGLEHVIHFVGTVPVDQVGLYVDLADILVSPRTAGTSVPLKIYSYLYSGKPIVATRLTAHTLVLTDDIAVLTEPTKDAFAEGLLKIIRDPELGQRLGRQARRLGEEKYGRASYLAKLDRVYVSLSSPHHVAGRAS